MTMLELSEVGYSYVSPDSKRITPALEGITFSAKEREFISIVGPSGCGKTTLLNIIAGFITDYNGTARLDGRGIQRPGVERGVVFQSASLFPWYNAEGNIAYGLKRNKEDKKTIEEKVKNIIETVGLKGFEKFYPSQLSGGMQQRVNLARALVMDPKVLLLDEPFASLDAQTRDLMQDELLRIWSKTHKTAILVTHQISEAIYLADRVFVFSARPGRIKNEIQINFGRPRDPEQKMSVEFLEYERAIWAQVKEEAALMLR